MIITCKDCNSSFSVGDSLIKDSGTKVRCSKCDSVFLAYPQSPENELSNESDEQLLGPDEDLSLEDLDASVDDFLEKDESLATEVSSEDAEDELGLNLDFDLEDDLGMDKTGAAASDDELPDLGEFEDLAGLDDESLTMDDVDTDLQDLDLELESETIIDDDQDGSVFELEDNGELEEEDSLALESHSAEDSEDLDLGLELDLESETIGSGEIPEADLEVEEADELDLSDLELEIEDVSSLDEAPGGESDDLTFDLDLDEEAEAFAGAAEDGAQELDLSELAEIVDQEEAPVAEIKQGEESDDLVLEVEAQPGSDGPEAGTESDELDLSDLEAIMESGETDESQESAEISAEDLDLDLDFQIDGEVQKADDGVAVAEDDELDFSDLEHMLEADDTPEVEAAAPEEEEELDLQFDIDEQLADGDEVETIADAGDAVQEDDLLDIEKMLEQGEDGAPPESAEGAEDDLELPLEMEAALDDASKGAETDVDLDFDLESEVQEKEELFDSVASGDEQLETNLLTPDEVDYLNETGAEEVEFQEELDQLGVTAEDLVPDEIAEPETKPKSGLRKPVYVTLLLFFLAVGILIIPKSLGIKIPYVSDIKIPYISDLDLKIPYLSDLLNPEVQDISGNLKMVPLAKTISCKFINNSRGGQLLVIRGKIKNEYDQPRSFVRVTGKIYEKGNKLVKTATVYCGNVLSDLELTGMNIAAINKKMHNKFGDKKSNLKIKTGKMVPFMIVFDKLPRNLDEYTVEVAGSSI